MKHGVDSWLLMNANKKSWVADRSVSITLTLSGIERRDATVKFYAYLLNYSRIYECN